MRAIVFSIFFLFCLPITSSLASYSNVDNSIKIIYNKFYIKVSNKYKNDRGLSYIKVLGDSLDKIKDKKTLSEKNFHLINDLITLNNEKIFSIEYNKEIEKNKDKISGNNLLDIYNKHIYHEDKIILENGIWYSYYFKESYSFKNGSKISLKDLKGNNIYNSDVLIFFDGDNLNFVKEYEKRKIISNDIIYGFPDKIELINTIKNNRYFINKDYDEDYKKLKKESIKITKGIQNKDEIIKKIYNYTLENVEYSRSFTLNDYQIFSGVETFKNKSGVCEGYVEVFNLMLGFNNIESQILKGDVIDAQDFPRIGHAWVKIGSDYYDPTFDDPIGLTKTKSEKEYNYFKLPQDLFYTNRYNYGETPEEIKLTTLSYRKQLIKDNLAGLTNKYLSENYNLLKEYKFKQENKLSLNKQVTLDDIKKIYGYYEMDNYKLKIDGEEKYIKNINYVILTNDIIPNILENSNYDLSSSKIVDWKSDEKGELTILIKEVSFYN